MKRGSVYREKKNFEKTLDLKAQSKVSAFFFFPFLPAQGRPSALIVQNFNSFTLKLGRNSYISFILL